jgi:dihydrofolate reductase
MSKVIGGATLSLDGFMAEPNGDLSLLYPDLEALRKEEMLQESMRRTGAVVMGRRAYDLGQGDFTGYEYQVPIFVLTHRPPEKPAKGENDKLSLIFVTDGIASAIAKAKAAAGDKDVTVVGGAQTAQACLQAGLLDEIEIGFMPILLGEGLRLFEHLGPQPIALETLKVIASPTGRTDIWFRVVK